jgi:hypothetical protein
MNAGAAFMRAHAWLCAGLAECAQASALGACARRPITLPARIRAGQNAEDGGTAGRKQHHPADQAGEQEIQRDGNEQHNELSSPGEIANK